jgi:hypothetical protein
MRRSARRLGLGGSAVIAARSCGAKTRIWCGLVRRREGSVAKIAAAAVRQD